MYHLRLTRALSYSGVVSATKKKPDVYVEDEATMQAALATGYFTLQDDGTGAEPSGDETEEETTLSAENLEEMNFNDLKKLAADMGIDTTKIKKKAELIEAISSVKVTPGPETDENGNEVDYEELD